MLEFLNPFLWGLLFSLVPIFIYIYKFSTRKTFILSTLKLLTEDNKSKGISINVELLKLFLRILIIMFIVLIFSQPFISKDVRKNILIILDTTYSSSANFEGYIKYLKEYLKSFPEDKFIKIVDLEGNEIVGNRKEVMDKIRFYFPKVGSIRRDLIKRLVPFSKNSEVLILTDGQKSFIDVLDEFGIKGRIVTFPFTLPYGKINFYIWNRVGNQVEIKYEVDVNEECLFEVFGDYGDYSKMLLSYKIFGRKIGELKITSTTNHGICLVRGILINSSKTNQFIEPIYLFDGGFDLILDCSYFKRFLEASLGILGFYVSKSSGYKIVVGKVVVSENFRNSIIVPCDSESKILFRGKNIFSGVSKARFSIKEINFSSFSLVPFTNLSIPEEAIVYGFGNVPVFIYDESRNNIILLGSLSYRSDELPWFLKEIIEFLFIYSKFEFVYPYGETIFGYVGFQKGSKYKLFITPDEEISDVAKNRTYEEVRNNKFISAILFVIFVIIMIAEKIFSS
ncbi:MAG: BatA domain-containing protein [Brevinematia bacterium]